MALTEIQLRLSLKKMVYKIDEVKEDWRAEKAKSRPKEPAVKDLMVMLEGLAKKYAAVKSNQQESARLSVMFAGGSPAEGHASDKSKTKQWKSKGFCWAFAKGKCTRGSSCRFRHGDTEAAAPPESQGAAECTNRCVAGALGLGRLCVPGVTYAAALRAGTGASDLSGGVNTPPSSRCGGEFLKPKSEVRGLGVRGDTGGQESSVRKSSTGPGEELCGPGGGSAAEDSVLVITEGERQKFAANLQEMAGGMAVDLGVSADCAMDLILGCAQGGTRSSAACAGDTALAAGSPKAETSCVGVALVAGVVADTGATVPGVGQRHVDRVVNVESLSQLFSLLVLFSLLSFR